jgi:hypothetical protein
MHDVSKVAGRRLQHRIIEGQLSANILQVNAQRLPYGVIPRRLQRKECCTAREPFTEVTARDSPLHDSPPSVDACSNGRRLPRLERQKHPSFHSITCPRAESRLSEMLTPSVGYDNPHSKRRTLQRRRRLAGVDVLSRVM